MTLFSLPLLTQMQSAAPEAAAEDAGVEGPQRFDNMALFKASMELAIVGTTGTLLNTWGIEHTTAIRAGLLLSSINVFTPLLAVLIGSTPEDRNVRFGTWVGCIASCLATAWATTGASEGNASAATNGLGLGDLVVIAATICYAATKVRLSGNAKSF